MKKYLTRMLLLLLTVLLTATSFSACHQAKKEDSAATTEPATQSTDDPNSIDVWAPKKDYGENGAPRQVVLLTFWDYNENYHFFSEEERGELLNDTAMKRTNYVNERYNVDLLCVEDNHLQQTVENSIFAGGGEFDLFYPHPGLGMSALTLEGAMHNLHDRKSMNLGKSWWNQDQVNNYTVNGRLYLAVSDLSLSGQGFVSMIYNRDIWNKMDFEGKEDLYQTVRDGTWTMEKLGNLSKLYGGDNGDGVLDAKDTYGLVYQEQQSTSFLYSMGERIVKYNDSDNKYELALNPDKVHGIAVKLKDLVFNPENNVFHGRCNYGTFSQSEMWDVFKNGQGLFMTYDIGALYPYLSQAEFDFGFLPLPKFDEAQESYHILCGAGFFAIPQKCQDPEMSGLLLEALAIYSYQNYRPAFINSILLTKLSENPEDFKMLEYLHEKKKYDIGYSFDTEGIASEMLITVVMNKQSTNTTSYIRARQTQFNMILGNLDKLAKME